MNAEASDFSPKKRNSLRVKRRSTIVINFLFSFECVSFVTKMNQYRSVVGARSLMIHNIVTTPEVIRESALIGHG
jgi:hypothetical protein